MPLLNPNDFIITRKRKKYRFALFANSELCFELSEWQPRHVDVIEIGAGTGLFAVELATAHPEQTFVALDVKADRLQKGARLAEARGLRNIWFVRARADQIREITTPGSVSQLWLTFADPFPKARSANRRMSAPGYLAMYAQMLTSSGELRIKHDNRQFFDWTLEQLVTGGWHLSSLSFDLHASSLEDEYKIMTTYEARWTSEGKTIGFVTAIKPDQKLLDRQ